VPFRLRSVTGALAAVVALGACATQQPRVPVLGAPEALSPLVGEWSGEYHGVRGGSILFTLSAAGDSATGDVVMVPIGAQRELMPARMGGAGAGVDPSQLPQRLTISFVRVSGDTVSGRLAPYEDPLCRCPVTTTFTGTLSGNRIKGTYQSSSGQQGKWEVERRKP
jgi:hypothetical protein